MSEKDRKKTDFVWDETRHKAAEGIARGENRQLLAKSLNTTDRTLRRWVEHPEFQRKIDEIIQDIDITLKKNRLKIIKQEIKRVIARLGLNQDNPTSRDLVALIKLAGEELGDYEPIQRIKGEVAVKIIDDIPQKSEKE